jgi:hypothetical protein
MSTALTARLDVTRTAMLSDVTAACHRLDFEPSFQRGLEGIYVLDDAGKKLATIRLVLHAKATCALRLDVHCERLQAALRRPTQQQLEL